MHRFLAVHVIVSCKLQCAAACADDPDGVPGQSVLAQLDVAASGQTSLLHGGHQVSRRRDAVRSRSPGGRPRHPVSRYQRDVAGRADSTRQAETDAPTTHHQGSHQRYHVNSPHYHKHRRRGHLPRETFGPSPPPPLYTRPPKKNRKIFFGPSQMSCKIGNFVNFSYIYIRSKS